MLRGVFEGRANIGLSKFCSLSFEKCNLTASLERFTYCRNALLFENWKYEYTLNTSISDSYYINTDWFGWQISSFLYATAVVVIIHQFCPNGGLSINACSISTISHDLVHFALMSFLTSKYIYKYKINVIVYIFTFIYINQCNRIYIYIYIWLH